MSGQSIYGIMGPDDIKPLALKKIAQGELIRYAHTPLSGTLFIPFAIFTFKTSSMLWIVFKVIVLSVCMYFIVRRFYPNLNLLYFTCICMFMLIWGPVAEDMHWGNWSVLIFACLVFAWICLIEGEDCLAGILIGLATVIRIYPGLFLILLILKRRYVALASAFAAIVVTVLVDINNWMTFVTRIAPNNSGQQADNYWNNSILSVGHRLFIGNDLTNSFFPFQNLHGPVTISLCAAIILALFWISRKDDADLTAQYCLYGVGMTLLCPWAWGHEMVFLLLPSMYYIKYGMDRDRILALFMPPYHSLPGHQSSLRALLGVVPRHS